MSRFDRFGESLVDVLTWVGSTVWLNIACIELLAGDTSHAIACAAMVGVLVCGRQLMRSGLWHLDRWKERLDAEIEDRRTG